MSTSYTVADRVKDTSTTTGTGDLTLSGTAPTGFQSFNTAFGTNVRFPYVIDSGGADWEVGFGYLSASTTLVREEVTASSNSGSAVNLSAGTKTVFCTLSASHAKRGTKRGLGIAMGNSAWRP